MTPHEQAETLKIGDVIYRKQLGPWGHDHLSVDDDTIELCRELVAVGRWVVVEKKEGDDAGE